ncbi:MAG: hypothetical protein AAFX76_07005 [Planctomycetota bacterium]
MTALGLLAFAWVWFVLGIASGALLGLGFHRAGFMGGYGSWRRRLARLGHISFFGTGFLALAMGLTASVCPEVCARWLTVVAGLLIPGAVLMPTVCFLSAWREGFRVWFFLPVLGLGGGVLGFTGVLVMGVLVRVTA